MKDKRLQRFYETHTWGANTIKRAKDMPNLKLEHVLRAIGKRPRAKLLEIGCGSGRILASIRERRPGMRLTGIDVSASQIRLARRTSPGITFRVGDGERLPFSDSTFDYVLVMDVLEHVEDPDAFLAEAARVLRKGGLFVSFVPVEGRGIYWLSSIIFGRHFKAETGGHIQQFTLKDLRSLLARHRLRIREMTYSYHLLGSAMDYALYTLLLWKRFARLFWGKNKYYQERAARTRPSLGSRLLNTALSIGNAVAYYESKLLRRVPLFATGAHIVAKK